MTASFIVMHTYSECLLIEYPASAVNVVSSNPCFAPSPRIKISFFFIINISTCTDKLILAPNIIKYLPALPFDNEKVPCTSNKMKYPKYKCLSICTILVNLAALNTEFTLSKNMTVILFRKKYTNVSFN